MYICILRRSSTSESQLAVSAYGDHLLDAPCRPPSASYQASSTDSVFSYVADPAGHYLAEGWIDGSVKPKRHIPSAVDNKEVKSKRTLRVIRS